MHPHKLFPNDIIMIHDEDLGFISEISAKEFLEGTSTDQIELGDVVETDNGTKRIVEMEVRFPDPGEEITKYKIILGVYPKNKK